MPCSLRRAVTVAQWCRMKRGGVVLHGLCSLRIMHSLHSPTCAAGLQRCAPRLVQHANWLSRVLGECSWRRLRPPAVADAPLAIPHLRWLADLFVTPAQMCDGQQCIRDSWGPQSAPAVFTTRTGGAPQSRVAAAVAPALGRPGARAACSCAASSGGSAAVAGMHASVGGTAAATRRACCSVADTLHGCERSACHGHAHRQQRPAQERSTPVAVPRAAWRWRCRCCAPPARRLGSGTATGNITRVAQPPLSDAGRSCSLAPHTRRASVRSAWVCCPQAPSVSQAMQEARGGGGCAAGSVASCAHSCASVATPRAWLRRQPSGVMWLPAGGVTRAVLALSCSQCQLAHAAF